MQQLRRYFLLLALCAQKLNEMILFTVAPVGDIKRWPIPSWCPATYSNSAKMERKRSNFQTRFLLIYVFNGANKRIMVVLRLLKFSQKKFSYPLIGVLTENVLEKTHARGIAYILLYWYGTTCHSPKNGHD